MARKFLLNEVSDLYEGTIEAYQDRLDQVFWYYQRCRRVLHFLGYERGDLLLLRDDFLEWFYEQQPGELKHSLITLQCAYDALQGNNSIRAIQLGTEEEKVDLNALYSFLDVKENSPLSALS